MVRSCLPAALLLWAPGAFVSSGCSEDEGRSPCLRPKPAFRLQVTAGGELLPKDLRLVVQYQGTVTEEYALSSPPAANEDVCCQPLAEPIRGDLPAVQCKGPTPVDAAVDAEEPLAGPPTALLCQVWTDGEAEIAITASGYGALNRILEAKVVEARCGLETSDVTVVLSGPDAGP